MTDSGSWILVGVAMVLAGGALGGIFFAGLLWTVRRAATSLTPARWFLSSMLVRTTIVLVGFYVVGAGQPVRLGLCMLGFLLARIIVLRATRHSSTTGEPQALFVRGKPPCA